MVRKALNDPSLEAHLATLSPDGVTFFSMGPRRGQIEMRGLLIHGTRAISQMRANHSLGPLETMTLGKALLCSGLMAALLKDPGSIMLRIDGSGPAEGMSAEGIKAPSNGISARGRLFRNPLPQEALEAASPIDLFGPGALTVTRMEGNSHPFSGSIPLRTGNINKDLTLYFFESEQTRTAVDSGIYFTEQGHAFGAGALLLQALPGADDDFLTVAESLLSRLPPLGLWFAQGGTRDKLIAGVFGEAGAKRTAEAGFSFDCPCSRERFLGHMAGLDKAVVADILQKGPWPLETECHYCSSTYSYIKTDFENALAQQSRDRSDRK
ncbi:MAG: Hsp33 family molecular chaperone HslO [Rectinemataceae bacterium]|nr:Hsp33 family molecular chaperone HslO [Rectinemataceae bacterium]